MGSNCGPSFRWLRRRRKRRTRRNGNRSGNGTGEAERVQFRNLAQQAEALLARTNPAVGREITDRSGLKFRSRYRDLLETLLGLGAGDLEAVDANHQVVKRWENILFLAFLWRRLDEILHQRSAVVDNAADWPAKPVTEDVGRTKTS